MLVLARNDLLSRYAGDGKDMVLHDQVQKQAEQPPLDWPHIQTGLLVQHIPVEDSKD